MMHIRKVLFIFFAAAAVSSCASNALRIESANAVSKAATAVVDKSKAALEASKLRRRDAMAIFIASEPSCAPSPKLSVYLPKDPEKTWPLCEKPANRRISEFRQATLRLEPIAEEQLKPILLLLSAVGEYGGGLTKITEKQNADITKELEGILEKATEASGLADGLLNSSLSELVSDAGKQLATDQGKAALALIQFASDLLSEAQKVEDIRAYVAEHGSRLEQSVASIKGMIEQWSLVYDTGDAQLVELSLRRAYISDAGKLNFSERADFANRVLAAREDAGRVKAATSGLLKAWNGLSEAHATLLRQLNGEFTEEERKKIAKENEARILKGLGLLASTAAAFGGI